MHLVYLLILGPYVADYTAVCNFIILADLVPVIKKSGVSYLNISNALEEAAYIVGYDLTPHVFNGTIMICLYFCDLPVSDR